MRRFVFCALVACSGESVEQSTGALSPTDSVATASAQSCSTLSVAGLAKQLVAEIQCMRPGTLAPIDTIKGVSMQGVEAPWLQVPAASALTAAVKQRGTTMTVNSALRTLPQQYMLYDWYQSGRCGIGLAAYPGSSNHESGLAVDIDDHSGWLSAMSAHGFQWYGSADPVHFDFVGGGTVALSGLDVEAFQRLWNRNHPLDTIAVDGSYGLETEKRLAKSPIGGFAIGAECNEAGAPPLHDAGTDAAAVIVDAEAPDAAHALPPPDAAVAQGCSSSSTRPTDFGWFALLLFCITRTSAASRAHRANGS